MSLTIDQAADEFNKILITNYPNETIPVNTMNIINHVIKCEQSRKRTRNHKTVPVVNPFTKKQVEIDKAIAKLIKYMWMQGIETVNSCEDNIPENYIWIEFADYNQFQKFMDILFRGLKSDCEIRNRAYGLFEEHVERSWIYKSFVIDNCMYNNSRTINALTFSVSLRFPKSDYDWVCQRFEDYIMKSYRYNCVLF